MRGGASTRTSGYVIVAVVLDDLRCDFAASGDLDEGSRSFVGGQAGEMG